MRNESIIDYLSKKSKIALVSYGVILLLGIGILDHYSGPEIGVSIFYLLPVSLITWFVGLGGGVVYSLAGALIWLSAELLHGKPYANILTPYWNASVRFLFFTVIAFLQHSLKNEQLHARVDPLTGIGNRRHFFQFANSELERSRRYHRTFTVAYIDLDNFKSINDSLGHEIGDSLLMTVARTIKDNIRATDTVARLGGDEFILVLTETEAEAASGFIEKLNKQLLAIVGKNGWPVTFSIGALTFVTPPVSVDEMIGQVDALMYSVKNAGKNSIRFGIF